jgi:serine/threonine protein kinase
VAIKRLKSETAVAAFLQEYKSLLKVSSPGHPNIIQTIAAEVREDTKAKITDFGLAIDFEHVKVFNPGTKELQSAVDYDAPELRRRLQGEDSGQRKPPTEKESSSGDIWKLGAVWVELVTYLILGSHGVSDFRKFITVTEGNLKSDTLTRFDDGVRVKPEVLEWLKSLSTRSPRATEMELLLKKMLDNADSRPDASEVVARMRLVSAVKSGLGTHAYT